VKGKVLISLFVMFFVFYGCTRSVRLPEPSPAQPEQEEVEKPLEIEVEKPIVIDYHQIPLEIVNLKLLEEKAGSYNSYNPQFSPDQEYLAVEVNINMVRKIFIYRWNRTEAIESGEILYNRVKEVHLANTPEKSVIEDFFESSFQESFNYEFSWFPKGNSFIFTSNAGMGEYNLFISSLSEDDIYLRSIVQQLEPKSISGYYMLTSEAKKDGQARVSPDGKRIVFTSGRSGNGDLYLLNIENGKLTRLTFSEDTDFFPRWSPDGRDIVYTSGGKKAHDIKIIRDVDTENQRDEILVHWFFDDILPSFSPDGEKISFYTTYNLERDPFNTKRWGIMIIPSDGSGPKTGEDLTMYFRVSDVIKDNTQGVAWFPDSKHIIYAKNIDSDYNPIYIYNLETGEERFIETETNINHDITVSPRGLIAFRAQVLGWDRIYIATTNYFQEYIKRLAQIEGGIISP